MIRAVMNLSLKKYINSVYFNSNTLNHQNQIKMAIYFQATDLTTKETIWISCNVVKNRPQLNSHRKDAAGKSLQCAGIDGFSAAELANLHTDYEGWQHDQHKYWCNPEAKNISFNFK